ncbi:MAG: hypothetical protein V9E90_11555 [Saprospiraceae bacterium]
MKSLNVIQSALINRFNLNLLLPCIFYMYANLLHSQSQCSMATSACISMSDPHTYVCIGNYLIETNLSSYVTSGGINRPLLDVNSAKSTPQYVLILGSIVVDIDYTFASNSILVIRDGYHINVDNKFSILANTVIRHCSSGYWDGIYVRDGGTLFMNSCDVSGALKCIVIADGSKIRLFNNQFYRNKITITSTNESVIHCDNLLIGNVINGSDTYSENAINLKNVSSFNYRGGEIKNFANSGPLLHAPISITNSKFTINSTSIVDNSSTGILCWPQSPEYHNLGVINCTFSNNDEDIEANGFGISMYENSFNNTQPDINNYSVNLNNIFQQNLTVKDNEFTDIDYGCIVVRNAAGLNAGSEINNNQFSFENVSSPYLRAISISGINSNLSVVNNEINFNVGSGISGQGISILGSELISVNNNLIEFMGEFDDIGSGIMFSGGKDNNCMDNILTGINPGISEFSGIAIDGSPSNTFECNTISYFTEGFWNLGNSDLTELNTTTFSDNQNDVFIALSGMAKIGIQENTMNKFLDNRRGNPTGDKELINENFNLSESVFLIEEDEEPWFPFPYSSGAALVDGVYNSFSCPLGGPYDPPCPDCPLPNDPNRFINIVSFIEGSPENLNEDQYGLQWDYKQFAYQQMLYFPELVIISEETETFFNEAVNDDIGKITAIENELDTLFQYSEIDQALLDILNDSIGIVEAGIQYLVNGMDLEDDEEDIETYYTTYVKSRVLKLDTLYYRIDTILLPYKEALVLGADVLLTALGDVSGNEAPALEMKKLLTVVLTKYAEERNYFTELDSLILDTISNLSYCTHGRAVKEARALLGKELRSEEEILCEGEEELSKPKANNQSNNATFESVKITQNQNLFFINSLNEISRIIVYDLYGRILNVPYSIKNTLAEMTFSPEIKGCYLLEITNTDGKVIVAKIIR